MKSHTITGVQRNKMMNRISHWQVQISDQLRSYKSTREIHVLAPEMIDAISAVAKLYPDARIFNCVHKGTFEDELYVRPKSTLNIMGD